jgi:hypothetical protein
MTGSGLQSSGSGYESAASCCEHANEHQDQGNAVNFLQAENLSAYQEQFYRMELAVTSHQ